MKSSLFTQKNTKYNHVQLFFHPWTIILHIHVKLIDIRYEYQERLLFRKSEILLVPDYVIVYIF